jgi:dihydropteroate synthase
MEVTDDLTFRTCKREMRIGERTLIMGILNVTPDSFSDGGRFASPDKAVEEGIRMVEEGADIIDVGGESTRPGSDPVSTDAELRRIVPVVGGLAKKVDVPISIDTTKASVAREAINCGAEIINDVSAMMFDSEMPAVASAAGAGLILMHMRGTPKNMQSGSLIYQSLFDEIKDFFRERMQIAQSCGVEMERTMIDPGIGFGKTAEDNMRLLKHLSFFRVLGRPILTGVSRKAFIGKAVGGGPADRLEGTAAAVAVAIMNGSSVIRVHDVSIMKKVAVMTDAILRA